MVYGFKPEYIGKRVWAYIPKNDGSLEIRAGIIEKFMNDIQPIDLPQPDPMYLVKYDNIAVPHAAQPEWLIFEPTP